MARPERTRTIRRGMVDRFFKPRGVPLDKVETSRLTLDQLEALRLADQDGLYHEEAATRMGVSRATFGRILGEARRIVAEALVSGKAIEIGGGSVDLRDAGPPHRCPVHEGGRRRGRRCGCDDDEERGRGNGRGSGRGRGRNRN